MPDPLIDRLREWHARQRKAAEDLDHVLPVEVWMAQADALVAAWKAMSPPIMSDRVGETGLYYLWCRRCGRHADHPDGEPTSKAAERIDHTDDCTYGQALAAAEALFPTQEDPEG